MFVFQRKELQDFPSVHQIGISIPSGLTLIVGAILVGGVPQLSLSISYIIHKFV